MMHALSYSVAPGVKGGLGHHAGQVLEACAAVLPSVVAFGPIPTTSTGTHVAVTSPPPLIADWRRRYTWRRYLQGAAQLEWDRLFGDWLVQRVGPEYEGCYVFTQIALELLSELRKKGTPHILDNPNGHIRDFHEAVQYEAALWLRTPYPAHPTLGMVHRVEEEYAKAAQIRVASSWAASSMVARGVDRSRISVVPHSVDLASFVPGPRRRREPGTLRVVFVGSLSLGKGFQYLLRAVRLLHSRRISVQFVGGTGDPWCRRLFNSLAKGLSVTVAAGDPRAAYQEADVLVLPTLHDGFGFVVAEAMACGLPVITTDRCGAAEWLRQGESGWVIPAGDVEQLAAAMEEAMLRLGELGEMGACGRMAAEAFAGAYARDALRQLVRRHLGAAASEETRLQPWATSL